MSSTATETTLRARYVPALLFGIVPCVAGTAITCFGAWLLPEAALAGLVVMLLGLAVLWLGLRLVMPIEIVSGPDGVTHRRAWVVRRHIAWSDVGDFDVQRVLAGSQPILCYRVQVTGGAPLVFTSAWTGAERSRRACERVASIPRRGSAPLSPSRRRLAKALHAVPIACPPAAAQPPRPSLDRGCGSVGTSCSRSAIESPRSSVAR